MMIDDFKKRFYVSLAVTVPIFILSPMIQGILGYTLSIPYTGPVLLALSSVVFFYGGLPFLTGLYNELKKKEPGMMTLIALAITVAYGYSAAVVLGLSGKLFFWELAGLIDIMLLGHWIEMRSVMGASRALEKLSELLPDTAHLLMDGDEKDVSISELQTDDIILVKPGEKIPADGIVEKGSSSINESMLTGESKPVKKETDDEVIAGSLNGSGSLEVRVQNTGDDSYLSKVVKLVEDAQQAKSKTQRLADRAALVLTIVALTAGFTTLGGWILAGSELVFAIERMATVMIITCPHALGLAIPLVVAVSTAQSAKQGLLIRNRTAFENARKITTVVFDKTGTLTEGTFGVTGVHVYDDGFTEEEVIRFAATCEKNSEHPIAQGILEYAAEKRIETEELDEFNSLKGKGIEGTVSGRKVQVVSPGFAREQGYELRDDNVGDGVVTRVFVIIDDTLAASVSLADSIRSDSYKAIEELKDAGISVWMLTGDNESTAKAVSEELSLDDYFAGVLPHEKQEKIKELQNDGHFVAMTGDGVNDAPALAQADVGIAVGSGTDVAAETADIIIANSNPRNVSSLVLFGRATYRKMVQNLIWATGYNVIAIPLAAGVLYSQGIVISPALGAVLMSLSTIIVAINARLLKLKSREETT